MTPLMPRPTGRLPKGVQSSHRLLAGARLAMAARLFSSSAAPRSSQSQPQAQTHGSGSSGGNPQQPGSSSSSSSKKPFYLRPSTYIYLSLGALLGTSTRLLVSPPPPPLPGSDADVAHLAQIRSQAESLPVVRSLTAANTTRSWDAYASLPPGSAHLTSSTLSGSRGIAFQRVFRTGETGEIVSVVHLGAGMAGWPGTVHGGASAMLLDESMGRCALGVLPARTGVTANLEVRYLRPVKAGGFCVIRCRPLAEEELEPAERGKRGRKVWVVATVEDLKGRVCVEARALFVTPRGFGLKPLGDEF